MTVRLAEEPDGRDDGRAESTSTPPSPPTSGCLIEWLPAVPLVTAALYYGMHGLVALTRLVIP